MTEVSLFYGPHHSVSIPVGSIYGIGLNYAEHIAEMQSSRAKEPVVFIKPATALLAGGGQLTYPAHLSQCMHHEVEMVLLVGCSLWKATAAEAESAIVGVGIGLDLTLRDRQSEAKAKGRPWSVAKGFKGSAPVSPFLIPDAVGPLQAQDLRLEVNGQLRQQGNTKQMLFSCVEIVQYLSTVFALRKGDLIFTGTPEGVSELKAEDFAKASLGTHVYLNLEITAEKEPQCSESKQKL